jgi:tetratricopeptide (TPR) repeat protein
MSDQYNQTGISDSTFGDNAHIEIKQEINAPRQKQPIPDNVPVASPNFVGRVQELKDIYAKLQTGQGVSVCAVEGMGGLGKSELARRYAWEYRQEYAARYWFSLRGVGLAQAVVTFASRYLDLPEVMQSQTVEAQAEWCWQNWTPTEGKVLVILDDVTDLKSIPQQARPLADRFQILVTTRKRKLSPYFADIPLKVISEDEALELLRKFLGAARVDREEDAAKAICEDLGYLPLGVELAARYLQLDEDLSLGDYQQRLTIADESLDLQETEEINAGRGVIAAFELSWQELSASTGKVAMLLGLFAPADIAWGLVEEIAADLIEVADLREGRKQLNNLYLIKAVDQERTRFAMHSLTREFLQWKLAQDSDTNRLFRETFVTSLLNKAKQIPQSPTRDLIAAVAPAIPHLDLLSREMLDDIPNPDEDLVWAFEGTARFYVSQGLYASALIPYQNCCKATESRLGLEHPHFAASLNNLASFFHTQGNYSEAESLYVQSCAITEKQLGKDHPYIASSLHGLAELYESIGKYKESESLHLQAISIYEKQLGIDCPSLATSLNGLAGLYDLQGKYKESETLYSRAISIYEKQLGVDHPYVATNINNLALLHKSTGKYKESETLYLRAISIWEKQLGINHPDIATTLSNLAELYRVQGKYTEAENLYLRINSVYEKQQLSPEHPKIVANLHNLALLYLEQAKYDESERLFLQSLSIRENQLGSEHPHVAANLNNLAELYRIQSRYVEAILLYERSLSIYEIQLGVDHPSVAVILNNLALIYCDQGRYDEAENLFLRAISIGDGQLEADHIDISSSLNNLAELYRTQGKYAEVENLLTNSLSIRETRFGVNHPKVANSLNNLAGLYESQGKYKEAEHFYMRALEICEQVLGVFHPNTMLVRGNYSRCLKVWSLSKLISKKLIIENC